MISAVFRKKLKETERWPLHMSALTRVPMFIQAGGFQGTNDTKYTRAMKSWEGTRQVSDLRLPRPDLSSLQPTTTNLLTLDISPCSALRIPHSRASRYLQYARSMHLTSHSPSCSHSPVKALCLSLGPLPGECCEFPYRCINTRYQHLLLWRHLQSVSCHSMPLSHLDLNGKWLWQLWKLRARVDDKTCTSKSSFYFDSYTWMGTTLVCLPHH